MATRSRIMHRDTQQKIPSKWFYEPADEFIVLQWPPRSPGLKTIEHIWDAVEQETRSVTVQLSNLSTICNENLRGMSSTSCGIYAALNGGSFESKGSPYPLFLQRLFVIFCVVVCTLSPSHKAICVHSAENSSFMSGWLICKYLTSVCVPAGLNCRQRGLVSSVICQPDITKEAACSTLLESNWKLLVFHACTLFIRCIEIQHFPQPSSFNKI